MITKNWTTLATVLRRANTGEFDRIITLYTKDLGKISAIAKGVRRPKSKVAGHLEPGNVVQIELANGKNLYIISGAKITKYLTFSTLDAMQALFIWLELIDKLTQAGEPNTRLFALVCEGLKRLSESSDPRQLISMLEIGLYGELGYELSLYTCAVGRENLGEDNTFSPVTRGIICKEHHQREHEAFDISKDAIKLLRLTQEHQYDMVQKIRIKPSVSEELSKVAHMQRYHILERDIKSEQI